MRGLRSRSSFLALALLLGAAGASSWVDGVPLGTPIPVDDGFRADVPSRSLSAIPSEGFALPVGALRIQERSETRSEGGLRLSAWHPIERVELGVEGPLGLRDGRITAHRGSGLLGLATSPANAPPRS